METTTMINPDSKDDSDIFVSEEILSTIMAGSICWQEICAILFKYQSSSYFQRYKTVINNRLNK